MAFEERVTTAAAAERETCWKCGRGGTGSRPLVKGSAFHPRAGLLAIRIHKTCADLA